MTDSMDQAPLASVMVVAADPIIETLVGELVAFAGHQPVFDVANGAGGESIRRTRPQVALIDTALPRPAVRACIEAATEAGSRVVLTSSTASEHELAHEAAAQHCPHFALPGGPRRLRAVLDLALERDAPPPVEVRTEPTAARRTPVSAHPAMCAALSGVARMHALLTRTALAGQGSRELRSASRELLAGARRSRAALRAAVSEYATQLRRARIPQDEALVQVRDTITGYAELMAMHVDMDSMLAESDRWVREAYRAA